MWRFKNPTTENINKKENQLEFESFWVFFFFSDRYKKKESC